MIDSFPSQYAAHQRTVDHAADIEHASDEIRPRVLADRRDAIRANVAKPNSDLFELLHDAWALELTQNMLDTLIRQAAADDSKVRSRAMSDENLGRAFRVLCETCIQYAANEELEAAVEAELKQAQAANAEAFDYADMDARR